MLELSTFELSTFELLTFELSTFELSTFELSTFELLTLELSTFELSTFNLYLRFGIDVAPVDVPTIDVSSRKIRKPGNYCLSSDHQTLKSVRGRGFKFSHYRVQDE